MLKNFLDPNNPVRVAVYGRVSTEHEAQLSALENQVQYYDNIINAHPNWQLVDRYIDKGITGTSMKKRDAFLRMMEDAKMGKFDLLVTREVCRFARNTVDSLQQVRNLLGYGVGVYFVEDGIWTGSVDEDWELKLSLMATLAQNESKRVSIRAKAGQAISFQNGVFYGNGNILGYDKIGKQMIVNKEQAATVRRIFQLYLEGEGLRRIQFILEEEGYKTATGNTRWAVSVIKKVLVNQFYCGTIVYRKQYVPDYLTQKKINNNGDVEQVVVEGSHEAIISKEDFQRVQEIMSSKTRERNGKKKGFVISKDVYCRKLICECGHTFNKRVNYTKKNGEHTYLYQCYEQIRTGTVTTRQKRGLSTDGICTAQTIPGWKLQIVSDFIFRKFFANKQMIYEKVMEIVEASVGANSTMDSLNAEIEKCTSDIAKSKSKIGALVDLFTDGDIPKEIYLSKKAEAEKHIEQLNKTLENLNRQASALQMECDVENRKRNIAEFLAVRPFNENAPVPEELVDYYVKAIEVDANRMNWILHIPDDDEGTKFLMVYNTPNTPKKKITTVTPPKKQVSCELQDRLLLTQNLNKSKAKKSSEIPVNIGVYSISKDYVRSVKNIYDDIDRAAKNGSFEVQITFMV